MTPRRREGATKLIRIDGANMDKVKPGIRAGVNVEKEGRFGIRNTDAQAALARCDRALLRELSTSG